MSYKGNKTPGEISGARQGVKSIKDTIAPEIMNMGDALTGIVTEYKKMINSLSKENKNYAKSYKAIENQLLNVEALRIRAQQISEDEGADLKDMIELRGEMIELVAKQGIEMDKLKLKAIEYGTIMSENASSEKASLTKSITQKQAASKITISTTKKETAQMNKMVDVANKDMVKSVSSAIGSIADNAKKILDTINLDKLANGGRELSETWKVMDNVMKSMGMTADEFQSYKNDIIDIMQDAGGAGDGKSIFSAKDVTKSLDTIAAMGVKDQETAKELVNVVAYGNKFLGMSAETQTAMYKLQRRSGTDGLIERQTAITAQLLQSQLNVSKEQLDKINQQAVAQADVYNLLGLTGENLENFTADFTKQSAIWDSAYGEGGTDALMKALASGNGAAIFGEDWQKDLDAVTKGLMNTGDIIDKYIVKLDPDSYLGTIAREYMNASAAEKVVIAEQAKANGVDESILKMIAGYQSDKGAALEDAKGKVAAQEEKDKGLTYDQIIDAAMKGTAEQMADADLIQNALSTEMLKVDWDILHELQGWGAIFVPVLSAISSILDIISWFKGGKWWSKATSWVKTAWGSVKKWGGKLLGKIGDLGGKLFKGIGNALKGAWGGIKTLGSGAKYAITGGKAGTALTSASATVATKAIGKVAAPLAFLEMGIDAFKGYKNTSKEMYGEDATTGQKVGSAVTAAFSSSKVHKNKKGEVSVGKNTAMGVGSGALKGAAIGALGGPVGAAIGAGIGAIAGGISGWFKGKKAKEQEEKEKKEKEIQEKQLAAQREIAQATKATAKNTEAGHSERVRYYTTNAYGYGGPISISTSAGGISSAASNMGMGGTYNGYDTGKYSFTSPYISKADAAAGKGRKVYKDGKLISSGAHNGIDFGAPAGTPIGAAKGGTVKLAKYLENGGGYQTWITGDDGMEYWYLHQCKMPPVQVGQKVKQGDTIGFVGTTGNSSGNHLHFGVKGKNGWVDPNPYLTTSIFTATADGVPMWGSSDDDIPSVKHSVSGPDYRKITYDSTTHSMGGTYDDSNVVGGLDRINKTLLTIMERQDAQEEMINALSARPIGNVSR